MDLGGITMRFEKWEEEAFNYLTALYENFFKELSEKCMDCFRIDSKELFSENVKELTEEQEKMIKDYWKKYTKDFDIAYHKYYIDRTGKFDERFIPDDLFVGYIDGYLNNATYNSSIIRTGDFYVTSYYNWENMKVRKRDSPKIERIHPIEIEKSIEYVLKLQYSSSRDDLMKQSSTHLGFTKLTTKVKSYFEEMINKMLFENKLSDDNGNISLKMD